MEQQSHIPEGHSFPFFTVAYSGLFSQIPMETVQ